MLIRSAPEIRPAHGPLLSRTNNFAALRNVVTEGNRLAQETLLLGNDYAKLTFHPQLGRGTVEFVAVADDFLVVISEADFAADATFRYAGENWIRFGFNMQGTSALLFDSCESARIERQMSHFMIHPEGVIHSDTYFARTHGRWVSILCRKEHLTEILGFDPEAFPVGLRRFLADGSPSLYLDSRPLNLAMCRAVSAFFYRPPLVALRPVYLKAKAYEALYSFLEDYSADTCRREEQPGLSRRDVERLHEARSILEREAGQEIRLAQLARRVGLNRSKLSHGFHTVFGSTIFDFSRTQRLTAARDLLRDTDLNVSQVAERCGYRHVSSFSAAFKLQFGVNPTTVREARGAFETSTSHPQT